MTRPVSARPPRRKAHAWVHIDTTPKENRKTNEKIISCSCHAPCYGRKCLGSQKPVHDRRAYIHPALQGRREDVRIVSPENIRHDAPLVMVLHGYGATVSPDKYPFRHVADKEGFAVCYPQGKKDGRGKPCWNVGYPFQEDLKRDDTAFLVFLARHLQKNCNLSRANTFVTGMSNGGRCATSWLFRGPMSLPPSHLCRD